MKNQRKAMVFGLLAVCCWSTVASAFKLALRSVDSFQLLLFSVVTSIVVLTIILAARRRLSLLFSCTASQYLKSLGLGLLNPFLYYIVLFEAYSRLPAQEAQPLNYTWAIALVLLSIPLLKQRPTVWDLVATFVCYGGALVICTRGELSSLSFSDPVGVGLALGSTVIWALYWIYNTKDDRDPIVGLLLSFSFSLPFVFAACLIFSTPVVTAVPGLLGALYVGVFEMGITFALWLAALRHAENTTRVANLIFLAPFLSLVLIHYVLGEEIRSTTVIGLIFIVGGLLVQQWGKTRDRAQAQSG